ncbi:MAG: transcriptional regulator [Candidatus Rokubacteria bacterium]|nr:transcriptional regulator [Candidatus Rokubacteria bacterium]
MTDAKSLIAEIKRDLDPVEQEIRGHPYVAELEAGRVPREALGLFAGEQYHIIRSDLRSVALLVNRFGATPSGPFFQSVLGGETAALGALRAFALAVGMDEGRLQAYEPAAGAQAYPAFMAWLALYGSDAEVAAGFLVNFSAWGANCGRMSRALQARYGLSANHTAFFDLFANPPAEFEAAAMAVVEGGLRRGADRREIKRAARLLQGYEKLYWDTLHGMSRG